MHHLKEPQELAGRGPERHHAIGIMIVAGPQASVEIRRGAPGRDENEVACRVHCQRSPRIGRAGFAGRRRVPGPLRCAGCCIERSNRAAVHSGATVIADRGADDDGRARNDRRRSDLVIAVIRRRSEVALPHEPSGLRIERNQPRVQRSEVHQTTRDGDPACRRLRVRAIARQMGIVAPPFRAGRWIERDHLIEWRNEIQEVADEHRRRFERRDASRPLIWRLRLGLVRPRHS